MVVGVRMKDGEKRMYHVDSELDHKNAEIAIRDEMPDAGAVLILVSSHKQARDQAPIEKESA